MTQLDRVIAGVSCREVLLDLSSLLDGELPAAREAAIRAHLAECRECDSFGGDLARTIGALRSGAADRPPLSADVARRLASRLAREGVE